MGYYINPQDGSTKEEWLKKHGREISPSEVYGHDYATELPVCLVDNGDFTAAGIAYDEREAKAFLYPDRRKKLWYLASREVLKPFYSE